VHRGGASVPRPRRSERNGTTGNRGTTRVSRSAVLPRRTAHRHGFHVGVGSRRLDPLAGQWDAVARDIRRRRARRDVDPGWEIDHLSLGALWTGADLPEAMERQRPRGAAIRLAPTRLQRRLATG